MSVSATQGGHKYKGNENKCITEAHCLIINCHFDVDVAQKLNIGNSVTGIGRSSWKCFSHSHHINFHPILYSNRYSCSHSHGGGWIPRNALVPISRSSHSTADEL